MFFLKVANLECRDHFENSERTKKLKLKAIAIEPFFVNDKAKFNWQKMFFQNGKDSYFEVKTL